LTWLGNTSRRKQRTPAHLSQTPLPQTANQVQAVNGLSPARLVIKTGKCLIQAQPQAPNQTQDPVYPETTIMEKQDHPWPRDIGRQDVYEPADATAGDDPANTETQECKEDTETQDGNATGGAA